MGCPVGVWMMRRYCPSNWYENSPWFLEPTEASTRRRRMEGCVQFKLRERSGCGDVRAFRRVSALNPKRRAAAVFMCIARGKWVFAGNSTRIVGTASC